MTVRHLVLTGLIALGVGGVLSPLTQAATFNVSNAAQLQTALTTAATNNEDDVINLAAGTYNTSDNGNVPFLHSVYTPGMPGTCGTETRSLTINGASAATTIIRLV